MTHAVTVPNAQLLQVASTYVQSCKPFQALFPFDRFKLPLSQDALWDRLRINSEEFRANYAVAVVASSSLALLFSVSIALCAAAAVGIASQVSSFQHALAALCAMLAVLALTTGILPLVITGACVGAVLCAAHAALLEPGLEHAFAGRET